MTGAGRSLTLGAESRLVYLIEKRATAQDPNGRHDFYSRCNAAIVSGVDSALCCYIPHVEISYFKDLDKRRGPGHVGSRFGKSRMVNSEAVIRRKHCSADCREGVYRCEPKNIASKSIGEI